MFLKTTVTPEQPEPRTHAALNVNSLHLTFKNIVGPRTKATLRTCSALRLGGAVARDPRRVHPRAGRQLPAGLLAARGPEQRPGRPALRHLSVKQEDWRQAG